ncbi:ABC transporter permease [Dermabacter sp. p3-SID358]|uniref:ABC transporter permease n=1 Tax=Dermabacter sp. p3-SID358 TaxID=2916114 RepID=UPI0021A36539|nr:ABC transporter permease [Dermabacter sp. p3-SID358]MCT1865952.1 ABC transporter permease [Dermabacter sp. p3-SID358]
MSTASLISTAIALALCLAFTLVLRRVWGVAEWADPAVALLRALVQLAILSSVLSIAITHIGYVFLALLVMLGFGVWTSSRRLGADARTVLLVALSMSAAVAASVSAVFLTGALEFTGQNLLAFGGIITGNAMSIVTLSGRRLTQDAGEHWGEIEGWLALGATNRRAVRPIASRAMSEALIPNVDQTRVTGIVTMPGAFVGAVFAGASPLEAGRFQLLVLAGIMATGTIAAALVMWGSDPIASCRTARAESEKKKRLG